MGALVVLEQKNSTGHLPTALFLDCFSNLEKEISVIVSRDCGILFEVVNQKDSFCIHVAKIFPAVGSIHGLTGLGEPARLHSLLCS
ncbi:hypothetical protein Y032_0313g2194 [Ancylostoma ceylanicum]|uniref:Uncharacterized protein n=1 Tax=Ancylostoma ceylanicum TaxID=53326 RepID=A0A016S316_9BILA|nr:hypothetical protein Y032_0313g2194 [Ancylostoma ceylanicum]